MDNNIKQSYEEYGLVLYLFKKATVYLLIRNLWWQLFLHILSLLNLLINTDYDDIWIYYPLLIRYKQSKFKIVTSKTRLPKLVYSKPP